MPRAWRERRSVRSNSCGSQGGNQGGGGVQLIAECRRQREAPITFVNSAVLMADPAHARAASARLTISVAKHSITMYCHSRRSTMTTRREMIVAAGLGGATLLAAARREAFGAGDGATDPAAARALLDRYVAAVNAHDTSVFAEIF